MQNFYSDNQPDNILTCHRIQNDKGSFDKNFFRSRGVFTG